MKRLMHLPIFTPVVLYSDFKKLLVSNTSNCLFVETKGAFTLVFGFSSEQQEGYSITTIVI